MKKAWLTLLLIIGIHSQYKACAHYDPDTDYFNLFAQETITNQAYYPFLLSYSNFFYEKNDKIQLRDENIEAWQVYFNNELTYSETDALLKVIDIRHLYNIKKGKLSHQLFKKLGVRFYKKYKEGLDYIIEAKYLEPYMRIKRQGSSYSFYDDQNKKDASEMNYTKNHKALISLYHAAKNNDIKLRYGYQIVRFNHYNGYYQKAIDTFNKYVAPLKKDTPIYWYALDQMAGAERGLGMIKQANYHFFQVFIHSRNRKESAYTSIRLSDDEGFQNLLSQVKNKKELNFAEFFLAYKSFNNEVPAMEKIFVNDTSSDLIKVLAARAINKLERGYLPYSQTCNDTDCTHQSKRLPFYNKDNGAFNTNIDKNYIEDLTRFITKAKARTGEDFWKITLAYLQFLQGKHNESKKLLSQIKTPNKLYQNQIAQIELLNTIVSQNKITPEFEEEMIKEYASFFEFTKEKKNRWEYDTGTKGFIKDILANRYFLQGEHGKSFLMNNHLSDLQYSPNSKLVKHVDAFLHKKNKTSFEKSIAKQTKDIGDVDSFFALIYGDIAMRNANFKEAENHYQNATKTKGIYRINWDGNVIDNEEGSYNGFHMVSDLVFGHNIIESFNSPENVSMRYAYNTDFPFIKKNMNKLELSQVLQQLQKLGKKKNAMGAKANQLIGNVLYNTSILGYYRHYFVMDINNENGTKFHFINQERPTYHFYYKNFGYDSFVDPDNFDLAIQYYKKALKRSKDKEQQARILFQMASAEQGKFYQWEATLPPVKWDDNWKDNQKKQQQLTRTKKNTEFRKYFKLLKDDYSDTKTVKNLKKSCSYLNYYML